jgi:hypothetical protein
MQWIHSVSEASRFAFSDVRLQRGQSVTLCVLGSRGRSFDATGCVARYAGHELRAQRASNANISGTSAPTGGSNASIDPCPSFRGILGTMCQRLEGCCKTRATRCEWSRLAKAPKRIDTPTHSHTSSGFIRANWAMGMYSRWHFAVRTASCADPPIHGAKRDAAMKPTLSRPLIGFSVCWGWFLRLQV